jgi:quercetin dioxygenase-like cupin family protein
MDRLEVVEDPVLRQRYRFTRRGDVLEVELWVDPGGGVTPHIHPAMEERFHVLAGRPSFLAGRRWSDAAPGETVVVPPGMRHAYRNRGEEVAHIRCEATPASTLQEFLEEVAELSRKGRLMRPGLPKTPGGLLDAAALAKRHRDMVVLLMPPPFVQRLVMDPLVALSRGRAAR